MTLRKDINGLRAIAVVAIMLFHFRIPGFHGGFVGVDVFFVISGFLMTRIVFEQMGRDSLSLFEFYLDRGRRVIPALAVLCLLAVAGGWCFLTPADYSALGKSASSSLVFVSNFVYWREAGYFDAAANDKWLLHTWSLSVEWQFYLLYPLVVLALRMGGVGQVRMALLWLAIASLAWAIYASQRFSEAGFFLLPSRVWEMLVGGFVYLFPAQVNERWRSPLDVFGLGLVAASIFGLYETDHWPGWMALVPVLGTAMVLVAERNESPFTSNRAAQWLGNASYSIYLWHWPIAVGLHYGRNAERWEWILGGLVLSLALGQLSYLAVEGPTRRLFYRQRREGQNLRSSLWLATGTGLVGALSLAIFVRNGFPSRFPFALLTPDQIEQERARYWALGSTSTTFPKTGDRQVLLIGNSYAIDVRFALHENGFEGDLTFLFTTYKCGNFGNYPLLVEDEEYCRKFRDAVLSDEHWRTAEMVLLHDHWPKIVAGDGFANLESILEAFRAKTDAPIYVLGPRMTYQIDPSQIAMRALNDHTTTSDGINRYADQYQSSDAQLEMNDKLKKLFADHRWEERNVHYVDLLTTQCGAEPHCAILSRDGAPLYFDVGHLTLQGARELGAKLKREYPTLFTPDEHHR